MKLSTASQFNVIAELEEEGASELEEQRRKSWVPVRVRIEDGQMSKVREEEKGQNRLDRGRFGSVEKPKAVRKERSEMVRSKESQNKDDMLLVGPVNDRLDKEEVTRRGKKEVDQKPWVRNEQRANLGKEVVTVGQDIKDGRK